MNTPVRITADQTDELFVNVNDLIIKLMVWADHAQTTEEANAYRRTIEYLAQKRDKAHLKG